MNKNFHLYQLGEFAAQTMLEGRIQIDFQLDNTGFDSNKEVVYVDYAKVFTCNIPDDLDEELIHRSSKSLSGLVRDSLKHYQDISWLRAGFTARGGLFADMLWMNLANNHLTSLSHQEIYDKPLKYDTINKLTLASNKELISYWKGILLNIIRVECFPTAYNYTLSGIRMNTLPPSVFYLDRLYYSRCYSMMATYSAGPIPMLIMKMGSAAFNHDLRYSAFGLLSKGMAMDSATTDLDTYFESRKMLNQLNKNGRLLPNLKKLILEHMNLELFEFLWLLNDIDTFESQLSEL